MEDEQKKKAREPIDEAYLMSIMAGDTKRQVPNQNINVTEDGSKTQVQLQAKERTKQRKTSNLTYGERFLENHSMTRRGEKSIYIRQEYHERLSRIIQVIGKDKIPLYAYLDNILEHHFELFEKAITEDFNNKFKPIF